MTCSDSAWHDVWTAFHSARGDEVTVDKAALAEVFACDGGRVPGDLVIEQARKYATCRRAPLFAFLTAHGAGCGKGEGGDHRPH